MHIVELVVAALACGASVSAAPFTQKRAAQVSGNKQFTVTQSNAKTPGKKLAGPIAYAQALGKYSKIGLTVPDKVKSAAAAAASSNDGTVTASPEKYDQAYLEAVTIGTQTLQLDFDTGSSDLWVFSNELPANEQQGHGIYTPDSTAKQLQGETWSITYGDGSSSSGNVYTDTVNVGGTIIAAQAIELASTVSSQFVQSPGDGLLGLGFSSINTVTPDKQKTFFANAESSLAAPLFTADLKKGAPGTYDFGFVDDTKHTGTVTYVPVDNSQGFWGFTTDGYQVGTAGAVTESIKSIADTGTSLLLLQDDVVTAYYATVSGATNSQSDGGYVFDCSTTLPDITLSIGGHNAVVPGSFINYAPASASGSCFGGIQSAGSIGLSIFGDIFLKSQFLVFSDASGGPQLGIAPKNL